MLRLEHGYVSGRRWLCFKADMAMLKRGYAVGYENLF
jgi:hypothetical protein